MSRGKKLTEDEKNKIDVCKEKNMSIRKNSLGIKKIQDNGTGLYQTRGQVSING